MAPLFIFSFILHVRFTSTLDFVLVYRTLHYNRYSMFGVGINSEIINTSDNLCDFLLYTPLTILAIRSHFFPQTNPLMDLFYSVLF
jgi:hypothetical protein